MTTILSIIIPVYNVGAYLSNCIESINSQNSVNIEIILINDGSTDNSGDIANKYAKQHDYIKVIHQTNQGVSVARNNGIKLAKGEYIWFVDGDDWLADGSIDKVQESLNQKADIVFIGSFEVYKNNRTVNTAHNLNSVLNLIALDDNLDFLILENILKFFPWDKVVKRSILVSEKKVLFSNKYKVAEDFLYSVHLMEKAKSFVYIADELYYYRRLREGSASTNSANENIIQLLGVLTESVTFILNNKSFSFKKKQELLLFTSKLWFVTQPEFTPFSKTERARHYKTLKGIYDIYKQFDIEQQVMQYNRGAKILCIMVDFFGFKHGFYIYAKLINGRRSKLGHSMLRILNMSV